MIRAIAVALAASLALAAQAQDPKGVLSETVEVYDPATGAYKAREITEYALDGRRLRRTEYDAEGNRTLLFLIEHDAYGREAGAWFTESDGSTVYRETFTYSPDGRTQTVLYFYEPDKPADRTEIDLDAEGRERAKRFFRPDGSQYGEEEVNWNDDGTEAGWDFRYLSGKPGARFEYRYIDAGPDWRRRVRLRDGAPERLEVRTRATLEDPKPTRGTGLFAPGTISTDASETSPSFTKDGNTMVFARYGDDWATKTPWIAQRGEDGWSAEPLEALGTVYNLAISPTGNFIAYSRRDGETTQLFRVQRRADGWSEPLAITTAFGLAGSYPQLLPGGDLVFYDAGGAAGDGLYSSRLFTTGYAEATPLYTPGEGSNFDGWLSTDRKTLLVTRCLDDVCDPEGGNGIWRIQGEDAGPLDPRLPYAWGVQPVPALGILIMTDGDDILSVPLDDYADALSADSE